MSFDYLTHSLSLSLSFSNESLFFISILIASFFTILSSRVGMAGLIAWMTAQSILSNVFVLKQIELFGFNVTASDVFTLSCMFTVLLIQENDSKKIARQAINASFITLAFFSIASQLHLLYEPSVFDTSHGAYLVLFGPNIRIVFASILAYWISQQCNIMLFDKLTKQFPSLRLSIRGFIAVLFAQAIDTMIFAVLGLYGLVSELEQIILFSFLIKIIGTMLLSQIVFFKIRRKEKI